MKRKIYEPVREFERATSYCPLYLAWRIVDEARDYFRTSWVPSPGSATLTRSRPLTRPSRAFASQIPFTASQAAQVSHQMGEGLANMPSPGRCFFASWQEISSFNGFNGHKFKKRTAT
jgi:hypothetical protein